MLRIEKTTSSLSNTCGALVLLTRALLLSVLCSTTAMADDWKMLNSDAINTLLSDRAVTYEGEGRKSQTFHSDGSTTYVDGRPSLGNWKVDGNQYCSQWPPGSVWTCYDIFVDNSGERVRFDGPGEDDWIAILQPVKP